MLYLSGGKSRDLQGHFDHKEEEEMQIGNVEAINALMLVAQLTAQIHTASRLAPPLHLHQKQMAT